MIGFWIVAGLLTAVVVILLARPLMRKSSGADAGGTDLAVYRDQLAELERERSRGLIEADQATSMETEISRRMLNAVRAAQPAFLYVYVEDADAAYRRAIAAGARSVEEPTDTPYGDRRATVEDKWGNSWQIATFRGTQ